MELTAEQYQVLLEWAERNFIPTGTINTNVCAYTIHGIFERLYDKGFYVTEFDVARALRECGYRSVERDGPHKNIHKCCFAGWPMRSINDDPFPPTHSG